MRFRFRKVTAVALAVLLASLLRAQVSEEEKPKRAQSPGTSRTAAAQADETPAPTPKTKSSKAKGKKTPSPTPQKSPSPKAKKKKAASEEEEPTPKPKTKASASGEEESTEKAESKSPTPRPKAAKKKATPKPSPGKKKKGLKGKTAAKKKAQSDEEEKAPKAIKATSPKPSETPTPQVEPAIPRAVAVPTPSLHPPPVATIAPAQAYDDSPQLTIEKSGYEKKRGFWSRLFGSGGGSSRSGNRYVVGSVRAEIDRAPADRRNPPWQYIVVHNSGTRQGNARVFDYYHKRVRRMQNGLAYHFVIGNGTSTGNGQIEVGDRWRRQINGGHVHSDHLNNIALGICLVGDFNRQQPTRAQLESCEELIRYLRQRCRGSGRHLVVKPHREMNPPRWATDCPGDVFPYSWFRRF